MLIVSLKFVQIFSAFVGTQIDDIRFYNVWHWEWRACFCAVWVYDSSEGCLTKTYRSQGILRGLMWRGCFQLRENPELGTLFKCKESSIKDWWGKVFFLKSISLWNSLPESSLWIFIMLGWIGSWYSNMGGGWGVEGKGNWRSPMNECRVEVTIK